ncbi:MAG: response regulator [Gammaproteobacteria bacterium]|nr:response regulator [Gammaproteobacteria bacterium]
MNETDDKHQGALNLDDGPPCILLLDDDEALLEIVRSDLLRGGCRVVGHTRPAEAIAAVRAAPRSFDLAILDYRMPGSSGLSVAGALREIRADLPIVLASGQVDDRLRAQAALAGVDEVLRKGDDGAIRPALLDRWFRSRRRG